MKCYYLTHRYALRRCPHTGQRPHYYTIVDPERDGFVVRQEWQTLVTNWQCFEQKTLVGWRDMEFGHITYQQYQNGMGGYAQWRDVHAPYSVMSDLEVYFSEVARGLRLSDTPLRYFVVVCPTFGRKWAFTANNPEQAQLIMDGWNRYQSYHTPDCAHTIVEETEEYLEVAIHNEYTIYARNQLR